MLNLENLEIQQAQDERSFCDVCRQPLDNDPAIDGAVCVDGWIICDKCNANKRSIELNQQQIDARIHVLNAIMAERERQEDLKEAGKFPFSCSDDIPPSSVYAIVGEEFGEIGRAVNENKPDDLYEEIIQVAACCLAWAEGITFRKLRA